MVHPPMPLSALKVAIAVQNAQVLAQTGQFVAAFQAALTNQALIDQAIGILMSRRGITADEAFSWLKSSSQREHSKLAVMAAGLVHTAEGRARDGGPQD